MRAQDIVRGPDDLGDEDQSQDDERNAAARSKAILEADDQRGRRHTGTVRGRLRSAKIIASSRQGRVVLAFPETRCTLPGAS